MKALIVAEPWIGLILSGKKTWEMRKTTASHRGPFALVRKGSGTVVGVARLVDSLPPLGSSEAYAQAEALHQIPSDRQARAFTDGWRTPWVIADARALSRPVPYIHPSGAVIWVNLDGQVATEVLALVGIPAETTAPPDAIWGETRAAPVAAKTPGTVHSKSGAVRLSGGNIRNHHINLRSIASLFPADVFGGSDRTKIAPRQLMVTFRPGEVIETDIDDTKKIFRARGAVGDFFRLAQAREGDIVDVSMTGPYAVSVTLRHAS